jgi:5'(3')-deoxyribonucleotidase
MSKKKKLLIALDLDGVLFDFLGQFLRVHNLRKDARITVDDIKSFMPAGNMEDIISSDDWNESFEWFEDNGGYATLKVLEGVRTALQAIIDAGHNLVYVTSRHSKFKGETELSLILNKLPHVKTYFTPRGKGTVLRKLNPDVFVDDAVKNCEAALRAGIKQIFLMDAPYNKDETRFTRIHNLIQFERELIPEEKKDEGN